MPLSQHIPEFCETCGAKLRESEWRYTNALYDKYTGERRPPLRRRDCPVRLEPRPFWKRWFGGGDVHDTYFETTSGGWYG